MKRKFDLIIVTILITVTALAFTGCSVDKLKSAMKDGVDILESAYFYDEDTGVYKVVCIIENNTMSTLDNGILESRALDKDGNRINTVVTDGSDGGLCIGYNWLGTGEKTAGMLTNEGWEDVEGDILAHYKEAPDSLEWVEAAGMSSKAPNLKPHGLSVKACEYDAAKDGWYGDDSVYNVTLHNDSETDYVFNNGEFCYETDSIKFSFKIVAVYRNADGEIKDAALIEYTGNNTPSVIPAGEDVVMEGNSSYRCEDDSLTPEYYIYIDNMY